MSSGDSDKRAAPVDITTANHARENDSGLIDTTRRATIAMDLSFEQLCTFGRVADRGVDVVFIVSSIEMYISQVNPV